MTEGIKGGAELLAFLSSLSGDLENSVIGEGLQAAVDVIADHARATVGSDRVKGSIATSVEAEKNGFITAKVMTVGRGAYIAPWLEFSTAAHRIAVRKNRHSASARSLKIGDRYVGTGVDHPGARAHPFLRPALDIKEKEAVEAMSARIEARIAAKAL